MPKVKKLGNYQTRLWKDEDMAEGLHTLRTSKISIYKVAKNYHLPYSTLRMKFLTGADVRPLLGPKTVFTAEEEKDMKTYIMDCTVLCIPITERHMALDIKHYALYKGTRTPFKDGIPGDAWFFRFKTTDGVILVFMTAEERWEFMNTTIELSELTLYRRNYIRNQNDNILLDSDDQIYLIEVESVSLRMTPDKQVTVVICSSATGHMLIPIILHSGQIDSTIEARFQTKLLFYKSTNGEFDRTALMLSIMHIHKHAQVKNTNGPLLVHLSPNAAEMFSFTCWQLCKTWEVIVMPLSPNVHNTLKTRSLGVFTKLSRKVHCIITARCVQPNLPCTVRLFVPLFWQAILAVKLKSQIKMTFSRMQLRDTQKKTPCPTPEMIGNIGDQYNDAVDEEEPIHEEGEELRQKDPSTGQHTMQNTTRMTTTHADRSLNRSFESNVSVDSNCLPDLN